MAKTFEKAVTGFNHNIKHKGKVYHVQTEDSGQANPHLITHLFVGGNILATKRQSYAEFVDDENLPERVREMMEEQHKEMLRSLVNGHFDGIEGRAEHFQPGQIAEPKAAPSRAAPSRAVSPVKLTEIVPRLLPPEVVAAQELRESPRENNEDVETLFGEDLISEKSLDEVILSYLDKKGG
jgi:hypothetical protein